MNQIDLTKVYISCECNTVVDYSLIEINPTTTKSVEYQCPECNKRYFIEEAGEWQDEEEAKQTIVMHIIQNTIDVQSDEQIEI